MDRVEITNVGGLQGAASEATLQQLLLATRKGKGDSSRVQELYNKSLNKSIRSQGSLTGEVTKTEKALSVLEKTVRTNSARLSEFVDQAFKTLGRDGVLSRSITRLTYFVDENVDRWRVLSQVGANFNNNLLELNKSSTLSSMSLSEFTDIVMNNSELLRSLGSTVTEGSVEFGRLSRELRRGFGRELMSMGFTFEDVNELLGSYIEISRRSMNQDRMRDREILEGTQAYAMELERLTRLTGMSRKQAQEAMQEQMRDQRVRMITANMSAEEQARFQAHIARASTEAAGFGEILTQLAAGDPGDELTRFVRTFAPDLVDAAGDLQNMSASEFNNFLVELKNRIDDVSQDMGTEMVAYLSRTDQRFAQLFSFPASLAHLNMLNEEQARRMEAEIAARDNVTQFFGNFSEVLRQVTTTIRGLLLGFDEFGKEIIDPEGRESFFGALSTLSTTIRNMFSPSGGDRSVTGVIDSFMGRIREIIQRFIGPTGLLTRGIQRVTEYIESGKFIDMFETIADTLEQQINRISGIIESMIAGDTSFIDGIKQIVFGDTDPMAAGLSLWERFKNFVGLDERISQGQTIMQTITNWFRDLLLGEEYEVVEPGTGDVHTGRRGGLASVLRELIGMAEGESIGGFATRMINNVTKKITDTTDLIISNFRNLVGMGGDQSFGDWIKEMLGTGGESIGSWFQGLIDNLEQQIRNLIGNGSQSISDWYTDLIVTTVQTIETELRRMLGMGENETFRQYVIGMVRPMTEAALGAVESYIARLRQRLDPVSQEGRANAAALQDATQGMPGVGTLLNLPGMQTIMGLGSDIGSDIRNNIQNIFSGRIVGTLQATGQPMEPRDTVAQIHAGERVLNPQETREYNTQANIQRDMVTKLDELNTSMHTMIRLMTQELAVQSRTMNSIKGLGPDLMKGIPG